MLYGLMSVAVILEFITWIFIVNAPGKHVHTYYTPPHLSSQRMFSDTVLRSDTMQGFDTGRKGSMTHWPQMSDDTLNVVVLHIKRWVLTYCTLGPTSWEQSPKHWTLGFDT